ncbi:MAG: hypothetical protein WCD13_15935 [Pseudolabrys sp.]
MNKWAQTNVVKFERRSRYSPPWFRRTRILELSQYRVLKYSVMIGVFAALFVAAFLQRSIDNSKAGMAPPSQNVR